MTRQSWPAYSAVAGFLFVSLVCLVELLMPRAAQVPARFASTSAVAAQIAAATAPAALVQAAAAPAPLTADDGYYAGLRSSIRLVQTRIGTTPLSTPDYVSRLLLTKSAANRAGLHEVGLTFRDVYGIISAETSWVPRMGASKDGTPNLGIAQFEPATARALGLRNPDDLVEAVHVAALHMKEAAVWSANRIDGLKLGADERATKLREGVSIYYNLSSRGRATWNGKNTNRLPIETQRHIANARVGADQAAILDAQLQADKYSR
ncbi:MAG: hypothetical protein ABIR26_00165, partial [Ramlibacter sp.]